MQKWMRDRMRRRKKKSAEEDATENSAPLQPVYPDEESRPEASSEAEQAPEAAPESEVPPEPSEATVAEPQKPKPRRRKKKAAKSVAPAEPAEEASEPPESSQSLEPVVSAPQPVQPEASVAPEPKAADEPATEAATTPVEGQETEAESVAAPVVAPGPAPGPTGILAQPSKGTGKRSSKGTVVLAVGLPGSGKSTWFKRHNVTPLSSDMVRHLLFDNATEQRYQDLVFGTLRSLLRARLIAKMPMNYVDATNLSPKERRHWIRMAKDFGYDAHAVYFDVPLDVCMERNHRRNRIVPEDVMQRMAQKLRPPTFDEGFAKIIAVRVKHKAKAGDHAAVAPIPEEPGE